MLRKAVHHFRGIDNAKAFAVSWRSVIAFACQTCKASLSMDDQYEGQPVRCPTCKAVVTVPPRGAPLAAGPRRIIPPPISGSREQVRRFGFNCPWCSSRLEATMATAGQQGQCPTCGNTIRIPIMDRYGRLIDPDTQEILKPDPHPVHAYAAAGDRAPKILRTTDGGQSIQCSRCNTLNKVSANSCRSCGVPFTLEGTVQTDRSQNNGFATTSLVLGVLGIPTCAIFVPSILAIVFGVIALGQIRTRGTGSRGTAIAGVICGAIGLGLNILRLL
jgi:LSD1 subclass zinc finger protein